MDADDLRNYLEFYQDLGIKDLYRRAAAARRRLGGPPSPQLPSMSPEGDSLLKILEDIGDCRRCRCTTGRNKIVFGVGNEKAQLVFVGEGPGADEDAQGIPFVGRAGQLLTQMIENTAKKEGIRIAQGCLHLQCREVPAAGKSHSGAGGDGDLRRVPLPPVNGDPAEGDLRVGRHRGAGADGAQGRRHKDARAGGTSGAIFRDGDLSPVVLAARLITRTRSAKRGKT